MGSRSVSFSFVPGENEQLETCVIIPEERRSIIHGVVKNQCNKVVKDAVVKLYEKIKHCNEYILKPLTHTFTDECGQFVFGPLMPCKCYVIKVWLNDVKIRELVIHPDKEECTKQTLKVEDLGEEVEAEEEDDDEEDDQSGFDDEFDKIDKIVKMQSSPPCVACEVEDLVEEKVFESNYFEDTDDLDE